MNDRVGQQFGNYQLIRLLGQGGFAEVYLGEHIHLKTQAAIKVLHVQVADVEMRNFALEAQTIANLKHPNIVHVLDFGIERGTPFLVMDFAPQGSLRQVYPKGCQVPLQECVQYIRQVASALQYAHDHKIIHRDVKPENMLIGDANAILLSDFGLAVISQSSRYQGNQQVGGTVAYMSPEQLVGKVVPASDQYALGIVLYEWLTGSVPFTGSFTEICSQHVLAQLPSLLSIVPMLPPAVDQVIQKALAKDPKQRFASIIDFAEAFELASQGNDPTHIIARSIDPSISPDAPTYKKPDVRNPPFMPGPGWGSPLPNQPILTPPPPPGYRPPFPQVPFPAPMPPVPPGSSLSTNFQPNGVSGAGGVMTPSSNITAQSDSFSVPTSPASPMPSISSMSTNFQPNFMPGAGGAMPPSSNSAAQTQGQAQSLQSQPISPTLPQRPKGHRGYTVIITSLVVLLLVAAASAAFFYYRSSNFNGSNTSAQTSSNPNVSTTTMPTQGGVTPTSAITPTSTTTPTSTAAPASQGTSIPVNTLLQCVQCDYAAISITWANVTLSAPNNVTVVQLTLDNSNGAKSCNPLQFNTFYFQDQLGNKFTPQTYDPSIPVAAQNKV